VPAEVQVPAEVRQELLRVLGVREAQEPVAAAQALLAGLLVEEDLAEPSGRSGLGRR